MAKERSMIRKMIDALTGAAIKEATDKNAKTAADLKDAVAKARAKADADALAKIHEEAKAAHAAKED